MTSPKNASSPVEESLKPLPGMSIIQGMTSARTTRLAPSPTGALHLGNARTFVINYALAKQRGWRILMRMEDLDGPRVKPESVRCALDVLHWMGITWEEPIVYQSSRTLVYQNALEQLIASGKAYPCVCSRKDIELAAGAPHADDNVGVYPNLCRGRFQSAAHAMEKTNRPVAWRVHVDDEPIGFDDNFKGRCEYDLAKTCGDFVVFRKNELAAYQLAVTVDDADENVDAIVRGHDLLESAARQKHLRRLLGLSPEPEYWHLPLVTGPDGRRLAKRHGDTRIRTYREIGTPPERILGLIAYWSGILEHRGELSMQEFVERFDIEKVPQEEVVCSKEDDAFLRA